MLAKQQNKYLLIMSSYAGKRHGNITQPNGETPLMAQVTPDGWLQGTIKSDGPGPFESVRSVMLENQVKYVLMSLI